MRRVTHVAALNRVVVDIFQLLSQHRLGVDNFRLGPFLPKLKAAVALVRSFVILKAIEQCANVMFAEVVDDPPRGHRLEIADFLREIFGRRDEMDVILEDHISEKNHPVVILEKLPRIKHDLDSLGASEHGQPADDRGGQEVGKALSPKRYRLRPMGGEPHVKCTTQSVADGIPTQSVGTSGISF